MVKMELFQRAQAVLTRHDLLLVFWSLIDLNFDKKKKITIPQSCLFPLEHLSWANPENIMPIRLSLLCFFSVKNPATVFPSS